MKLGYFLSHRVRKRPWYSFVESGWKMERTKLWREMRELASCPGTWQYNKLVRRPSSLFLAPRLYSDLRWEGQGEVAVEAVRGSLGVFDVAPALILIGWRVQMGHTAWYWLVAARRMVGSEWCVQQGAIGRNFCRAT